MGSSERGRFPQKYIRRLAEDTIGIGIGRRFRKRLEDVCSTEGINMSRSILEQLQILTALNQVLSPMAGRYAEVISQRHPHSIMEKYSTPVVLFTAVCLDVGIDAGAILLAITGHIGEGLGLKVAYNIGANAFFDKAFRKPPISPDGTK